MKIFKQKLFFIKATFLYIFLIGIISILSLILWENSFYDMFARNISASKEGANDIAVIVIDDNSLKTYRWPWKRSLYGDIFNYFNKYTEAKAIAFDSVLHTLDIDNPQSDQEFFSTVKKTPKLIAGYMAYGTEFTDRFKGEFYNDKFQSKFAVKINDQRSNKYKISGYYSSIGMYPDKYFNALSKVGFVNVTKDFDDILRKSNDLITYNGILYPSLSLRTYMYINNIEEITVTDKYIINEKTGLKIPTVNESGNVKHYIKFYKFLPNSEYSFKKYSAIDIINSEKALKQGKKPIIDPKEFENKIIYIGANAKAAAIGLSDVTATPMSYNHAGIDYQAIVLNNYLNNEFITKTTFGQNILIIGFLSILSFAVIMNFSFIISLLILLFVSIFYITLSGICFKYNIAPLVITPVIAQISTMVFGYSYRFILEGRNKEKIKQAMGKYLSQDIMQNVVQNIDDIKLGGKKANVTVLFADIRGFTSMSEKMSAEDVSKILNEYFSEIEPIITKYNGVINKFIGDAVMAIFGEPIQDINHPANAVKCAYEMLKKVEWLQDKWLNEGKPKIEIGIGINTGEAFVGNIGSEKRLEYTVIGDMVNLASRIESYNKVYKTNLLISSSTYSYVCSLTDVIKISEVTIRGKSKKMDIYEVLKVK